MLFSSLEFLYLFFPLCVLAYFAAPRRAKNTVLLAASLLFYALPEPKLLPLLVAVSLVDFLFGMGVYKLLSRHNNRGANTLLALAVAFNAGVLFIFKYLDPTLSLFGINPLGITLPTGISFYVFQALSYVIDVRRGAAKKQKSFAKFLTYVTLFPQLVAGPIVRYCEIDGYLDDRRHSFSLAADGVRLFAVGLAKKVLLADLAAGEWSRLMTLRETFPTALGASLALIFFSFQIYFDFSGYSNMARGLGKIFGFEFPINFNYPYTSASMSEFWRRWHITLSTYFREYVYFSLGGSRRGKRRMYLALFTVWSLTGIWHGASLNFLAWGLYFFLLLCAEKAFLLKILRKAPSAVCRAYTLSAVAFGWLIFCCDGQTMTLTDGISLLGEMLCINTPIVSNDALFELFRNLPLIFIMAVGCTPTPRILFNKFCEKKAALAYPVRAVLCVAVLLLCTCFLATSTYKPFLYFRF